MRVYPVWALLEVDSADKDGAGEAIAVRHNIKAVILPVNAIDVGNPSRPKNHRIARRFLAIGMHRRITFLIRFCFYNLTADNLIADAPYQGLSN